MIIAAGAYANTVLQYVGVELPIIPVRGTMWSTRAKSAKNISNVILGAESHEFWSRTRAKVNITHEATDSKRLTRNV